MRRWRPLSVAIAAAVALAACGGGGGGSSTGGSGFEIEPPLNQETTATPLPNVMDVVDANGVWRTPLSVQATEGLFIDSVAPGQVLTGADVRYGHFVDGIRGLATPADLAQHGKAGGDNFTLEPGEHLVRAYGYQGHNPDTPAVSQISFLSSRGRTFGPFGADIGQDQTTSFDFIVPGGSRIVGFQGSAGEFLGAIGLLYVQDTPPPAVPASPVFGAAAGTAFADAMSTDQVLSGVVIWYDSSALQGIQGLTRSAPLPLRGSSGTNAVRIELDNDEYLIRMFGRTGGSASAPTVVQVGFTSSKGRTFGPYGNSDAATTTPFDFVLPAGGRVVGFSGLADTAVTGLAVQYALGKPAIVPTVSRIAGSRNGLVFTDRIAAGQVLTGVTVHHGSWVDAVRAHALPADMQAHGGRSGGSSTFTLEPNEHLVRVFGLVGNSAETPAIAQISFETNTGRVYGPYGEALGQDPTTPFDIRVPAGTRIVGFTGYESAYLNAIGVLYMR